MSVALEDGRSVTGVPAVTARLGAGSRRRSERRLRCELGGRSVDLDRHRLLRSCRRGWREAEQRRRFFFFQKWITTHATLCSTSWFLCNRQEISVSFWNQLYNQMANKPKSVNPSWVGWGGVGFWGAVGESEGGACRRCAGEGGGGGRPASADSSGFEVDCEGATVRPLLSSTRSGEGALVLARGPTIGTGPATAGLPFGRSRGFTVVLVAVVTVLLVEDSVTTARLKVNHATLTRNWRGLIYYNESTNADSGLCSTSLLLGSSLLGDVTCSTPKYLLASSAACNTGECWKTYTEKMSISQKYEYITNV